MLATAFSGVGHERFNASVLLAAVLMIGWYVWWMSSHGRESSRPKNEPGKTVQRGHLPEGRDDRVGVPCFLDVLLSVHKGKLRGLKI